GKGLLLNFDADASLRALAQRWNGRIAYVASDAKERLGLSAVLVRPDGVVAWAGESAIDQEAAALAASRWFGAPGH
ncbi:MAG: FAD-dependent oxidoreductase, partial [Lysobacter sp.]